MQEVLSTKTKHPLKQSNPNLYSQFLLYDYHSALNKIPQGNITFDNKIKSGNWEFIIAEIYLRFICATVYHTSGNT